MQRYDRRQGVARLTVQVVGDFADELVHFEGAGIHGTEDVASLGSAASHGCVRMAIADVEALYDQVEVGTPIFIG